MTGEKKSIKTDIIISLKVIISLILVVRIVLITLMILQVRVDLGIPDQKAHSHSRDTSATFDGLDDKFKPELLTSATPI